MPRIVAEALVAVPDPLTTTLTWPVGSEALSVAAGLAQAAPPAPSIAGDAAWLRVEQRATARRVVGVIQRHGGALLADPVGSGKTFVALAVAAALREEAPVAVIAPAPLLSQWDRRAESCAIPVEILSHVSVSRGRLPDPATRIVLIDESHHFRHPETRRYEHLAPFLVGRRVLCITATPVVNRLEDLAHQLLLGVRDDALRSAGTLSLRLSLRAGQAPPALGELVVASPPADAMPQRRERTTRWEGTVDPEAPAWLPELDALALSTRGPIAALVRCVLLGAAASSPAALRAALGRYAMLLRHGEDARRAGRPVDRALIRRFTAEAPEQLLLWELMPTDVGPASLPLEDLARVERLRAAIDLSAPDAKALTLAGLIADGTPTLVFANAVATIPYLRDRLVDATPAWITGTRAGWRHVPVPREQVLDWFRPGAPEVSPRVLLASDVAAEGLDLQRAARVVHYDLPWTAMRLAQREGRSRRLGGTHTEIEVIRMDPPGWLERRLRIGVTLQRKSLLGRRAGLEGDESPWRWRHDLGAAWGSLPGCEGIAAVEDDRPALLIGVRVETDGTPVGVTTLALIDAQGGWAETPERICERLEQVRSSPPISLPAREWDRWREQIVPFVRTVLRRATESAWASGPQAPAVRVMVGRIQALARCAARERDATALGRAESLLAFATRGHTAGESHLITEMLALDDAALLRTEHDPQGTGAVAGIRTVRIVGAVAFSPR